MPKKIRVGILFGGKSTEHEVSLLSARNVIAALDRKKYTPVFIGIDRAGRWHQGKETDFFTRASGVGCIPPNTDDLVALPPTSFGRLTPIVPGKIRGVVDVVFPVLHGAYGEDGTVQGLLKLAGVPFVGAGVLGSAVGMDKDVMKRLLREAGLPVARFITLRKGETRTYREIVKQLGTVIFVKPANAGSSVGVSKVVSVKDFSAAVQRAFAYDTKVIIEEGIEGREIECAVLGNQRLVVSIPGEVIPTHEFYSYEAKYLDPNGARYKIPAKLPIKTVQAIQKLTLESFRVLECTGLGRVDFFLTKHGQLYVNEINTLPGFTEISMYPKLFAASGIDARGLVDRLIALAFERFNDEEQLRTSAV